MTITKQITDTKIDPNTLPENITVTPINIILPKNPPKRDDNVWLEGIVKVTPQ